MSSSIQSKLEILADAAKYDASCASSGAPKRDSRGTKGTGSTTGAGICHSYTPDGRCVSLLKILLTNSCIFDCAYCINRRSSNVRRARFTVDEVVTLTLEFYKRNYIEGLFLSSGIIRDADYTMEQLVEVAHKLREEHHFRGYIHLKAIPEASQELTAQAGINRGLVYVTNAMKHFKFEPRGKRRIHKKPNLNEIEHCRWWLDRELALIQRKLVVALGGTAPRALTGKDVKITEIRGQIIAQRGGATVLFTVHPSYLLRLPDAQTQRDEYRRFVHDLSRIPGRIPSVAKAA